MSLLTSHFEVRELLVLQYYWKSEADSLSGCLYTHSQPSSAKKYSCLYSSVYFIQVFTEHSATVNPTVLRGMNMKRHIEGGGQLRLRPPWVIKILGFQVFEAPMGEMPPPVEKNVSSLDKFLNTPLQGTGDLK